MSITHTLQIPIHLDGFLVEQETLVTEAFADFSRLPHTSVEEDHNPDIANLSESVLSQPFQNKNLTLARGMHLHWSLPDALTRGGSSGTAEDQLAVPNRWLIQRKRKNEHEEWLVKKQWIVESDYLHPAGEENPVRTIAYPDPFHRAVDDPTEQPFRYLGRQLDATHWTEDINASRLPKLTALGYGEPAFAAFYPNCLSVFGCFDEGVQTKEDLEGLQYEIVGWYSHTDQDPLREFTTEIYNITPSLEEEAIKTRIQEEFLWNVQDLSHDRLPVGMTCYARLNFDPKENINNTHKSSDDTLHISIGNTGTEALSALLAQQIGNDDKDLKDRLEEQLEHLFLQSPLQAKTLDVAPRFKQARHDKGFNALKGGSLWQLTPLNENNEDTVIQLRLPPHMADTLNELNLLEQESAQLAEELTHLKRILFADWYKYMLCAYPPDDARDQYPDIDLVRYYIEQHSLPAIDLAKTDFEEKQVAIAVTKNDLEEQVTNFNQSKLDSEPIFIQKLDDHTPPLSSDLILSSTAWEDNQPFSNECLVFDGEQAYATLSPPADFNALSLWLNITTQQKQEEATLLALDGSMGTLMSKATFFDTWSKLSINGIEQASCQTLQWHDLPKDQWFHLYIEFSELQSQETTLHLFSDAAGENHVSGKLAGIRLFSQGLSTDAIFLDQN
ncbi:MAG: hypothetical protein MK076_11485, partial [Flavobacteriales bacterium]|nr:hypothetical protein [Flavobacteriales bacterium]